MMRKYKVHESIKYMMRKKKEEENVEENFEKARLSG